jgi:hydroxymethylbilane synthase
MAASRTHLRIGTRGSLLARAQAQLIADQLMRMHPEIVVELIVIKTSGDQVQDRPLYELGGKGLFTKEIEQALIDGNIDLAVHSFKDLPVTMPLVDETQLIVAGVPKREDWHDVAVMRDPVKGPIWASARIGTSSLRRRCQILELCPDAQILPLRGNIDTRIRKLRGGEYDVIVLAMAGLKRAGLLDSSFMKPIDILPAPGQGALAIQCRRDDARTRELVAPLNDPQTTRAVELERAVVAELQGDCHSPIAALAELNGDKIVLKVAVGARDGNPPVVRAEARTVSDQIDSISRDLIGDLRSQGADKLLRPQT